LAPHVVRVLTSTLLFPICNIAVKRIVLSISYHSGFLIETVRALLVCTVVTFWLRWCDRSYLANAFGATSRRGMVTLTLRLLFHSISSLFAFLSIYRTSHTMDTFLGRNMVAT